MRTDTFHQPIRIGVMRLMLLRSAARRASHSETSHSYYSENRGYVNNLKLIGDSKLTIGVSVRIHDCSSHFSISSTCPGWILPLAQQLLVQAPATQRPQIGLCEYGETMDGRLDDGFIYMYSFVSLTYNRIKGSSMNLEHKPSSVQFSFIYIAPNYNNCHLKAL